MLPEHDEAARNLARTTVWTLAESHDALMALVMAGATLEQAVRLIEADVNPWIAARLLQRILVGYA
jgi:hypothetical protein